jgi:4-coumarate--CoA ligase
MDLVSFALDMQGDYNQDKPLYINAENPTISLSARQTRTLVKQLVAGFQQAGLSKDDAVMLCMPNNVS